MPETWMSVALAAAIGAICGWWPLARWAGANLQSATPAPNRMRSAVALTTAAGWALAVWSVGWSGVLPALLGFFAAGAALVVVDGLERRLPNRMIAVGLAVVEVLLVVAALVSGEWLRLVWAAAGGAGLFAVYLVLALVSPRGMGMGDVKFAALIGLPLGWFGVTTWFTGLAAGFVIGAMVSLVALALRRVRLRGALPFGPSMLAGAAVALLVAG